MCVRAYAYKSIMRSRTRSASREVARPTCDAAATTSSSVLNVIASGVMPEGGGNMKIMVTGGRERGRGERRRKGESKGGREGEREE